MHIVGILTASQETKRAFIQNLGLGWGLINRIGLHHDSPLYVASKDSREPLQIQYQDGQRLIIGGTVYGSNVDSFSKPMRNQENLDMKLPEGNFWFLQLNPNSSRIDLGVDRFAMTSLYFRTSRNSLFFSTDLHDMVEASQTLDLDDIGISCFFVWGYPPPPKTVYKHISVIPAASYITIRLPNGNPVEWRVEEAISPLRRYWAPKKEQQTGNPKQVAKRLFTKLQEAVDKRAADTNAIFLSGGLDSSLTLDLLSKVRKSKQIIAITGAISGIKPHEDDFAAAPKVAQAYGIQHETVIVDPNDSKVVGFWKSAAQDWGTGTHLGSTLWYAMAHKIGRSVEPATPIFTAETADTMAEFTFTGPARAAYINRFLYSPEMLSLINRIPSFIKKAAAKLGKGLLADTNTPFLCDMVGSWLRALGDRREYFDGLLLNYGQFPGVQANVLQRLAIVTPGFDRFKRWVEDNLITPYFLNVSPETLQYNLLSWKLDIFCQGQDVKIVINSAQHYNLSPRFPFLDAEVVNLFATLPPFARRFYKSPKHFIKYMAKEHSSIPDFVLSRGCLRAQDIIRKRQDSNQLFLSILLKGPLGEYFHELLKRPVFLDLLDPEVINVPPLRQQIGKFHDGKTEVDLDLIYKAASLEEFLHTQEDV